MTNKYDLTKKLRKKQIVVVCMVSQEDFNNGKRDTLEYKINNVWINMKPPFEYKKYSHGICNNCIKQKYPTIYNSLVEAGKIIEK